MRAAAYLPARRTRAARITAHSSALTLGTTIGLLVVPLIFPAYAEAAGVSVTPVPSEMTLAPTDMKQGRLVLVNGGMTLARITVEPVKIDGSLEVELTQGDRTDLPRGDSTSLPFIVRRTLARAGETSAVVFVIDSVYPTSRVREVVTASVGVKMAPRQGLFEAKIEPSIGTINENRPGESDLLVTNTSETAIATSTFLVHAPRGVKVTFTCPWTRNATDVAPGTYTLIKGCEGVIPAREQQAVPLSFATEDAVAPGPRSAFIKIMAGELDRSAPAGELRTLPPLHSAVAGTAFTVDVFAESEILKALSVPIFLMLPGFLVVITLWFLVRLFGPWKEKFEERGDFAELGAPAKAGFAVVLSLVISFVMAWAYPWLTDQAIPGHSRNYLRAYGFRDFHYVFTYSLLAALILWLAAFVLAGVWRKTHKWKFELYEDQDGDHWRLREANGQVVTSSAAHASAEDARSAVEKLKANAASATLDD